MGQRERPRPTKTEIKRGRRGEADRGTRREKESGARGHAGLCVGLWIWTWVQGVQVPLMGTHTGRTPQTPQRYTQVGPSVRHSPACRSLRASAVPPPGRGRHRAPGAPALPGRPGVSGDGGNPPCPHPRWEARTCTRQTPEGALLPTPCPLKVAGAALPRGGLLVTSLTQQNPVEEARPCGRKKCPIYLCS